jgi:hypothetical protein
MLVHGDGFTVTEAAKLMSTSESTTRTRYATALQTLRAALHEYSQAASNRTGRGRTNHPTERSRVELSHSALAVSRFPTLNDDRLRRTF